jgi:hypothetical protein
MNKHPRLQDRWLTLKAATKQALDVGVPKDPFAEGDGALVLKESATLRRRIKALADFNDIPLLLHYGQRWIYGKFAIACVRRVGELYEYATSEDRELIDAVIIRIIDGEDAKLSIAAIGVCRDLDKLQHIAAVTPRQDLKDALRKRIDEL